MKKYLTYLSGRKTGEGKPEGGQREKNPLGIYIHYY